MQPMLLILIKYTINKLILLRKKSILGKTDAC
jgi:hypothetical protein